MPTANAEGPDADLEGGTQRSVSSRALRWPPLDPFRPPRRVPSACSEEEPIRRSGRCGLPAQCPSRRVQRPQARPQHASSLPVLHQTAHRALHRDRRGRTRSRHARAVVLADAQLVDGRARIFFSQISRSMPTAERGSFFVDISVHADSQAPGACTDPP